MRSKIWRHLKKYRYTSVIYNNKKLYCLNQILNDTELVSMMARPEMLLAAIEHD
ncbi:MAG: hypothetical protein AB9846_02790 [Tenuifilaceae bacterium]